MLPDAARAELVRRFRSKLARIQAATALIVARAWDDLPGYDEANVDTFEEQITTPLSVARRSTVTLANGFYSTLASKPARSIDPATVPATFGSLQPFTAYWHSLSQGNDWDTAVVTGRSASDAATLDFVTSTSRRTGGLVIPHTKFQRWQRIPSADACEWCLTVAEQTYESAETADFGHDRCSCTAVPA